YPRGGPQRLQAGALAREGGGRLGTGRDERWGVHGPTVEGPTAGANGVFGWRSARPAPARSRAHVGEGDRPASSIVGPIDEYESTRRSSPAGEAPNPSSLTAPLSGGGAETFLSLLSLAMGDTDAPEN